MTATSRVRTAGLLGMAGSLIWTASVLMQNSLGLSGPDGGSLWVAHQLVAFTGIIGAMFGYIGVVWGNAFGRKLGPTGIGVYVLGWVLILAGGVAMLALGPVESPIFLLFPVGGTLQTLGCILIVIAGATDGRWAGWQRWMPLIAAVVLLLAKDLPMALGITPDGPGMLVEIIQGVVWLGVGLSVFTIAQQTPDQVELQARTTA